MELDSERRPRSTRRWFGLSKWCVFPCVLVCACVCVCVCVRACVRAVAHFLYLCEPESNVLALMLLYTSLTFLPMSSLLSHQVTSVLAGRGDGVLHSRIAKLMHSPQFARACDLATDAVVLMQTIYLTVLASDLQSGEQSNEEEINRAILGFLIVFTIEIGVKLSILGRKG
jgi:hypothetical protein